MDSRTLTSLFGLLGLCAVSSVTQATPVRVSVEELSPARIHLSSTDQSQIGRSVCLAGDLTGDGYIEIAVGAPAYSPGLPALQEHHGAVFVLHSRRLNLNDQDIDLNDSNVRGFRLTGTPGSHFGASLANIGDVNSDGYDDLAIGAPGAPAGIILYGRDQWRSQINLAELREGAVIIDNTGHFTAAGGDLNQDGFLDVLFGHPSGGNGGLLTVVFGGQAVPRQLDALRPGRHHVSLSGASQGRLGVTAAGRLIISPRGRLDFAALADAPEGGQALFFQGGPHLPSRMEISSSIPGAQRFVHNVGDLNGDGFSDIAIGAPDDKAWLIWGRDFKANNCDLSANAPQPWGVLLENAPIIAAIGDIDGNGFDDVAIGLPDANVGAMEQAGAVVLLFGEANWPNRINIQRILQGESARIRSMVIYGASPFSRFGASLHGGPDIQGDGYADLIIGAPSIPGQPGGGAYVLQGRMIQDRLDNPIPPFPFVQ